MQRHFKSPHPPSTNGAHSRTKRPRQTPARRSPAASKFLVPPEALPSYVDTHPNPSNPLCKVLCGASSKAEASDPWIADARTVAESGANGQRQFLDSDRLHLVWLLSAPNGAGPRPWPCGFNAASSCQFQGGYEDGKAQGLGVLTWSAGGGYDGEWRDGKMNGRGIKYLNDGGSEQGRGVTTPLTAMASASPERDGARYMGEWHHSLPNGQGITITQMAKSNNGIWVNGLLSRMEAGALLSKLTWIVQVKAHLLPPAVSRALPGCRPQGSTRTRGAAARPADRQYSGTGPPS